MLNLEPFAKALDQLTVSLDFCRSDLAKQEPLLGKQFRAAAIQAFEYTFEISIRMLKRRLKEIISIAEVERLSYRDLLRVAAEKGFVDDPVAWFDFREMRNLTSHSYDESKADLIAAGLPEFAEKARFLLAELLRHAHMKLRADELQLVKHILRKHVPGFEVWAYGSRVHGRHVKPYSDLDLAIITPVPLPLHQILRLRSAFSESDLSFRVDVTDWSTVDQAFRAIIKSAHEILEQGEAEGT